jgi:hypothetical protein
MGSQRRSPDAHIAQLDGAASVALAAVGPDAASQLTALSALSALSASLPEDGLLRELVLAFAHERRAAFVAFHEASLRRATSESSSSSPSDTTASAFAEALAFTIGLEGDGEAAAALRALRDHGQAPPRGSAVSDASSSSPSVSAALPRPFFARFLAHQER